MRPRPILFLAAGTLALLAGLHSGAEPPTQPGVRLAPPAQAAPLRDRPEVVVLDIRTPAEVLQARMPGPLVQLDFYAPDFATRVAELDRDAPYLLYCRSGQRSGQTRALMTELGFTDVVDLEGGLMAWAQAGLPIEQGGAPSA